MFTIFLLPNAFAMDGDCHDFAQPPLKGRYCIYLSPGSTNKDVIYYFHGKGDPDAQDPLKYAGQWGETGNFTEQIRQYWSAHKRQPPTVIAVSFGPIWLLAHKNQSAASGLLDAFTAGIMPSLEKAIGGVKGRRILLGLSMGGFNVIQLALQTNLFQKAAALCAPMAEKVGPYSTPEDIEAFIKSSAAYSYYGEKGRETIDSHVGEMVFLAKVTYPEASLWNQADPMTLAQNADRATAPKMYLAAGFYDPYALYEGNIKFASILKERGLNVQWRPQWGGHCAIDIPSLSSFLIH